MAEPFTQHEWEVRKSHMKCIDGMHEPPYDSDYDQMTVNVGEMLRLYATIDRLRTIEQELVSACELLGLHECSVRVLLRHLRNNYSAALGALRSVISRLEERLKAEKRAGRIL